jgi:hypothetical protein
MNTSQVHQQREERIGCGLLSAVGETRQFLELRPSSPNWQVRGALSVRRALSAGLPAQPDFKIRDQCT